MEKPYSAKSSGLGLFCSLGPLFWGKRRVVCSR
jgi:hypothetical protein